MHNNELEEPDVTPLININLVILVMVLAIASHAAKLLPLVLPTSEKTDFLNASEAVTLSVGKNSSYQLGDKTGLAKEDLQKELTGLEQGTCVIIRIETGVKYESLVTALDCVMTVPGLKVAFGNRKAGNVNLKK